MVSNKGITSIASRGGAPGRSSPASRSSTPTSSRSDTDWQCEIT